MFFKNRCNAFFFFFYNLWHFEHCRHGYKASDLKLVQGLAKLLFTVDLSISCTYLDTPTLISTVLSDDDLLLSSKKTGWCEYSQSRCLCLCELSTYNTVIYFLELSFCVMTKTSWENFLVASLRKNFSKNNHAYYHVQWKEFDWETCLWHTCLLLVLMHFLRTCMQHIALFVYRDDCYRTCVMVGSKQEDKSCLWSERAEWKCQDDDSADTYLVQDKPHWSENYCKICVRKKLSSISIGGWECLGWLLSVPSSLKMMQLSISC